MEISTKCTSLNSEIRGCRNLSNEFTRISYNYEKQEKRKPNDKQE